MKRWPRSWFDISARYSAGEGELGISSDGVLLAIEAFDEDIWLVTFPIEPGGPSSYSGEAYPEYIAGLS